MAKSEWGIKRSCRSCGESFYDLKKKNIECPKCGAAFNPNPPARPKRSPPPAAKPMKNEASVPTKDKTALKAGGAIGEDTSGPALNGDDLADDAVILDSSDSQDDEKNDALIKNTSDLSRDDDHVSEVKEHIDDSVEDKN